MKSQIKCPKCGEIFTIDENSYSDILKQVRDEEFKHELEEREKSIVELEKQRTINRLNELEAEKNKLIESLRADLRAKENEKSIALIKAENEKNNIISDLKSKLDRAEIDKKAAVVEAVAEKEKEISEKNQQIIKIEADLNNERKEREISEKSIKDNYNQQLVEKDRQIEQARDFKARLSTKMVGESLEQHCEIKFNEIRATAFPHAYFEKDNDVKTGSKGDYIFRDYAEDGMEYVSIMFEMKNEMDDTTAKHKNEEFFKKLDKDRKDKNCEYAVLVSMLEADSELYNNGIVDVSYKYEKMYVIRPQFFIPIITMLRNTALHSLSYKQELAEIRAKNIDVTNFENDLEDFKKSFSNSVRLAGQNFESAMKEIDNTINHLEKVREALRLTQKQLLQADGKAEDLTIKKLTRGNPTMQVKFAELEGKKQ